MASCCASGPGSSMQKLSACRNRDWLIHLFFSTSSVCIIAIWPVGPPKEMNPSLSQKRNASRNVGSRVCRDVSAVVCCDEIAFIAVAKTRRARRSTQSLGAEFHHLALLLL